jgi:hypothetical protein
MKDEQAKKRIKAENSQPGNKNGGNSSEDESLGKGA